MKKKLFKKLNIHNYFITYIIMSSQKKSFEKLRKFLAKFRVKSGQKHSNTSMGNLKGSFYIPDDKYEKFLDVYEEAILNGNTLSLIEKHTIMSPIIIDLDFRHDYDAGEPINREFTDDDIKNILSLYYEEIRKIFIIDEPKQLIACVFQRSTPYVKDTVKRDGVHIMFPYIISEPNAQFYLRNAVLNKLTDELDELKLKNNKFDVIDRCVIESNGWFLYGSTKPKLGPYEWKHTYNMNMMAIRNLEDMLKDAKDSDEAKKLATEAEKAKEDSIALDKAVWRAIGLFQKLWETLDIKVDDEGNTEGTVTELQDGSADNEPATEVSKDS